MVSNAKFAFSLTRILILVTTCVSFCSQASSQSVDPPCNKIESKKVVVYCKHDIAKGALIKAGDIQETVIAAGKTPDDLIQCSQDIIGCSPIYKLECGQIPTYSAFTNFSMRAKQAKHEGCPQLSFVRAKTVIDRGAMIEEKDLETFTVPVGDAEPKWESGKKNIVNHRAKVTINAGQIITSNFIE